MEKQLGDLIKAEGNKKVFEYKGYKCFIWRSPVLLMLCGYVLIPKGHALYKKVTEESDLSVHGGITFNRLLTRRQKRGFPWPGHWVGFDCGHYQDLVPGMGLIPGEQATYKNMEYVESEIKSLVDQLVAVAELSGK